MGFDWRGIVTVTVTIAVFTLWVTVHDSPIPRVVRVPVATPGCARLVHERLASESSRDWATDAAID